jgi:hypothetical protein
MKLRHKPGDSKPLGYISRGCSELTFAVVQLGIGPRSH